MPFRRKRKRKDGTIVTAYYTDIRPRAGGTPTGERVRKLLPGVTNMADARKAEARIVQESEQADSSPLVSDFLLTTYLDWARENKAAPWIYERFARAACESPQFRGRTFAEFSVIQAEGYKKELRAEENRYGRKREASDINARLAVLSRAFQLANEAGLIRGNPFRLVARLDYRSKPFLVLDPADEPKLWESLKGAPGYALPAARLALLTGMREGELLALKREDVDFAAGLVFVRRPKWRKDPRRTEGLPVCEEALRLLAELCADSRGLLLGRPDGSAVPLSTCSRVFKQYAGLAGLKGFRFHFLRHTFGTRLGEMNASPYTIARLMGHANIQTSMIYVHPATESLREAVETVALKQFGRPADTRRVAAAG